VKIKYVNLERSPDRNSRMQEMLIKQRLDNYSERFPGVLSSNALNGMSLSETGCFLSHHSLIMSLNTSESTVILEDDVCLCADFGGRIQNLIAKLESMEIDILILGQTVPYHNLTKHAKLLSLLGKYKENGKRFLLNANPHYSYGTFGYIVNRNSVIKIKDVLNGLDFSKSAKPMDELLGDCFRQGVLKGRIVFPYLAGVEPSLESTMFDRTAARNHAQHAELVNLYLDGYLPSPLKSWEKIISESPNLHALEICRSIYLTLNHE
jgi:GR25 family glycosyltransferase involved in LPS biosynthesis